MHPRQAHLLLALAAATGAIVWTAIALVTGRGEAWDHSLYWQLGLPACIAVSGILGFVDRYKPWRWSVTMMAGQFAAMAAASPGNLSLLPLGIVLTALLSVPGALAAYVGAWLGRLVR